MKSSLSRYLFLAAIFFLGMFFRFSDINWDQGNHLHPDERFLTMVGVAMKPPASFIDYLNPAVSTFNPTNIKFPFYVYGIFPVTVTKLMALALNADTYADFTILGRVLSGLIDLVTLFLVYKTLALITETWRLPKHTKYWGAFFYAVSVLPIQLSHFFAVDTFLSAFGFASFYFLLKFQNQQKILFIIFAGILWGLALSSKISAIYTLPLLFFFMVKPYLPIERKTAKQNLLALFVTCFAFGMSSYLTARIADPYLFQNGLNFLDPRLNSVFLANIKSLQTWANPTAWFPPSVQWIHKTPILFAFINLCLFGLGIAYTLLAVYGMVQTGIQKRRVEIYAILGWMILFFLYESVQFSKTMRYFIQLYPFLAMFAAIGYLSVTKKAHVVFKVLLITIVMVWPLLFYSIYTKPHSRTQASNWIYQFVPSGSILVSELWDDSLPVSTQPPADKVYVYDQIHIFDPESPEKWATIQRTLAKSDYLVLSSNRGWGSIPTVPERYPTSTKFYADLFAGKTNYKKVAEFTSYPSLRYLGIPITFPDDWSEEAFTVYDHPKVMIFKKQ